MWPKCWHGVDSSRHEQSNWRQNNKYQKYHKQMNKTKREKKQSIKESCRIYPFLAQHGFLCVWQDLLCDDVNALLNATFKTRFFVWPRLRFIGLSQFFWLRGLGSTPCTLHGRCSKFLTACNAYTYTRQTGFDLSDPSRHTAEWVHMVTI